MATPQSLIERRGDQMLPLLDPLEIERVRRFGTCESFAAGAALYRLGQTTAGLMVILTGKVEVTHLDTSGRRSLIVTHGPGHFLGELAQLAGRLSLADAVAVEPVRALIIPPDRCARFWSRKPNWASASCAL